MSSPARRRRWRALTPRQVVWTAAVVSVVLFIGFTVGAVVIGLRVGGQFVSIVNPAPPAPETAWAASPFERLWQVRVREDESVGLDRPHPPVMLWPSPRRPREVWVRPANDRAPWRHYTLDGAALEPVAGPRFGRPVALRTREGYEFLVEVKDGGFVLQRVEEEPVPVTPAASNTQLVTVADFDEDGQDDLVVAARDAFSVWKVDGQPLVEVPFRVIIDAAVVQWDGKRGLEGLVVSTGRRHAGGETVQLGMGLVLTVIDAQGEVLWERRLDDFWYSKAVTVAVDGEGVLTVVLAAVERSLRGLTQVHLVAVDESGAVRWRRPLGRIGSFQEIAVPLTRGRFQAGEGDDLAVALDDGTVVLLDPGGRELARHATGRHIRTLARLPREDAPDVLLVVLAGRALAVAMRP